jgi:FtsH-binding integral membrane protein
MSAIFYVYQEASIYSTFLVTAAMFACMAIYGYFTKADLTSVGSISLMILVGMIFAGLVNLYFQSPAVSYAISAIGVVIFSLLTAYDAQKIKEMSQRFLYDYETSNKIALYGALALYLDFINLFLSLLRFMGQRRND